MQVRDTPVDDRSKLAVGWLRRDSSAAGTLVRLVCFPHAGGGASSFNGWRAALPAWIELVKVQLPGREDRRHAPAPNDVPALMAALLPDVLGILDKPLVLYGHSLGALLAFELSRSLRRNGYAPPLALLISSRRAPHLPIRPSYRMHTLPEEAFGHRLEQLGGLPPGLLARAKWRSAYLPTIRADLALSDDYVYRDEPPLGCPLHTFIGEADDLVVREDWEVWSEHAGGEFTRRVLPGGHFFSKPGWQALIAALIAVVEARLGPELRHARARDLPAVLHTTNVRFR